MSENYNIVCYKFLANLYTDNPGKSVSIPCEISLPTNILEKPKITFIPTKDIFDYHPLHPAYKLQGELGEGLGSLIISATGVRFHDANEKYWGNGLIDRSILGSAENLQIISHIPCEGTNSFVSFYLSNSCLLSPRDILTCKNGSITIKNGNSFKVDLLDGVTFTFENEYKYNYKSNEKVLTCWPILTAKVNAPYGNHDRDELLSAIDDFLLLVSFAESRRIACLEMAWFSEMEHSHEYRINKVAPKKKNDHSFYDCLIYEREHLEKYFKSAFTIVKNHPQKKLILGALAATTQFDQGTIETKFIRNFSAFESIILAYRRTHNLEYSIDDTKERNSIVSELKRALRNNPVLKNDSERRKLINENISGLFRISLKQASECFFDHHGIYINDIWPIFGTTDGISLVTIRNKIAHGDSFFDEECRSIAEAGESLRLLVNRCMLATLDFSYQNSAARPTFENKPSWKNAQLLLTQSQQILTSPD